MKREMAREDELECQILVLKDLLRRAHYCLSNPDSEKIYLLEEMAAVLEAYKKGI